MSNNTLHFFGGVSDVTGANFVLDTGNNRVMVDCGLTQGARGEAKNKEPFGYDVKSIDAVCITHAHIDHIGRLPQLVAAGYNGPIYSTDATADLAALMLEDAFNVMSYYAEKHDEEPLYDEESFRKVISLWKGIGYHQPTEICSDVTIELYNAGHVLGAAVVVVSANGQQIAFTGDLGNDKMPLLPSAEVLPAVDYIVMESVYGDREHEQTVPRKQQLKKLINQIADQKGTLMIPAFSMERSQEILFDMNELVESGEVPSMPVFLDSPLAIKVTRVYRKYTHYFNDTAQGIMETDEDIFGFPGLQITPTVEDSKMINDVDGPKIVIAGSGMSHGGRMVHHERMYLPEEKSMLVMVGYQAAGTLGRRLSEGQKEVEIYGTVVPVRATIETISGYSGHKDVNGLVDFIDQVPKDNLKKVFCVMGEEQSALFLTQRLRDYLGVKAVHPAEGQSVGLE